MGALQRGTMCVLAMFRQVLSYRKTLRPQQQQQQRAIVIEPLLDRPPRSVAGVFSSRSGPAIPRAWRMASRDRARVTMLTS